MCLAKTHFEATVERRSTISHVRRAGLCNAPFLRSPFRASPRASLRPSSTSRFKLRRHRRSFAAACRDRLAAFRECAHAYPSNHSICDNRHIRQTPMTSGSRPPALSRFGLVAAGCTFQTVSSLRAALYRFVAANLAKGRTNCRHIAFASCTFRH